MGIHLIIFSSHNTVGMDPSTVRRALNLAGRIQVGLTCPATLLLFVRIVVLPDRLLIYSELRFSAKITIPRRILEINYHVLRIVAADAAGDGSDFRGAVLLRGEPRLPIPL